jgi:hypothetical protein
METSLLIFAAAETGANEQLPSKMTSASGAIPAFRQCLPSRCLPMDVCSIIPAFSRHVTIFSSSVRSRFVFKKLNERLNFIENTFHKSVQYFNLCTYFLLLPRSQYIDNL